MKKDRPYIENEIYYKAFIPTTGGDLIIHKNERLVSRNGHYCAGVQTDGNFVIALYDSNPPVVAWSFRSNQPTRVDDTFMQVKDGRVSIVQRSPRGDHVAWERSFEAGSGDYFVQIGDGGQFEIHGGDDPNADSSAQFTSSGISGLGKPYVDSHGNTLFMEWDGKDTTIRNASGVTVHLDHGDARVHREIEFANTGFVEKGKGGG
jgi:hypothetical protein